MLNLVNGGQSALISSRYIMKKGLMSPILSIIHSLYFRGKWYMYQKLNDSENIQKKKE